MTKMKKVNSINLSSETLKAVSEILTNMDSVQVSFPRSQLKSLFELQFQNEGLNFTKLNETNMSYKDGRVQAIYLSFKAAFLSHSSAIQRALSKINKSSVSSPYIIGMQVEDNTVQFGFRPFKHKDVDEAKEQAKVLADRHGKPYTVFGALDTIKPEGVKHARQAMISETRQGHNGRLKSYMVGVMQDLQALTKEVDISKEVFPSGIKFLPDGTFAVTFYNDDKIIVDRSMVGAVQIVEKHMNGFKSKVTPDPFEIANYQPSQPLQENKMNHTNIECGSDVIVLDKDKQEIGRGIAATCVDSRIAVVLKSGKLHDEFSKYPQLLFLGKVSYTFLGFCENTGMFLDIDSRNEINEEFKPLVVGIQIVAES